MEYSFLGNSGLKVSRLCLGAATFTESGTNPRTCNQDTAHKILDRFVEAGGNFIDTSDNYWVRSKDSSNEIKILLYSYLFVYSILVLFIAQVKGAYA